MLIFLFLYQSPDDVGASMEVQTSGCGFRKTPYPRDSVDIQVNERVAMKRIQTNFEFEKRVVGFQLHCNEYRMY